MSKDMPVLDALEQMAVAEKRIRAACEKRIASLGKDKAVINCQWVLDQLEGK